MSVLSVSEVRTYRDLNVWKNSIIFSKNIYSLTQKFPANQQYGLKSQMERAAVSVASNIAEGAGRNGTKEFIYHLGIALGSLFEVETQIIIAKEIGFINEEELSGLLKSTGEIGRMIAGLRVSLEKKKVSNT